MSNVVTTKSSAFISRFHVDPKRKDEFVRIFDSLWKPHLDFMNEQCNFVFYGWDRDEHIFYAIESYKDEELLKELRKSGVFQTQVSQLMDCCNAPMEMELARGMDSDRSCFDFYKRGPSEVHPIGKNGLGAVFS
ncbi:hypothetical protein [Noviherbaspirillum sedimenti]|uniref:ABM domain-containing protein n=1 Tax=Noviherbaspirillum sedimenti TaxID=2320865 RepID=A0A3A3G3Z2_9BURK|nr:hypothetical protein [Noviherbaspirillum sedimenti]RJG03197.1 hypothetical protein D3878_17695 [Noviherbaspirillum sedimenti]